MDFRQPVQGQNTYMPPSPALYGQPPPPPSYPPMVLQEFVIANGITDRNLKAFPSETSMRMYKEYNKLSKHHSDFPRAKSNQNASIGLPLVISKRCLSIGLGDTSYLRFFECVPAPEARDRLYDKVDNRHIGEVLRRKFIGYTRYRLQLKGVETVVFAHSRLPIVDLRINDERFRFVKAISPVLNPDRFSYDLYLLTQDQVSLVDNMDSSRKVHKSNSLLGGSLHNIFPIRWCSRDRSKYISPHKCGSFDYYRSWEMFTRTKKCSVFSMYTYAVGNVDATAAVEFRSLILVAVSLILQSIEDDLHSARTARRNSNTTTNNVH